MAVDQHSPIIDIDEGIKKGGINAKQVLVRGYDANTDSMPAISAKDGKDGSYGLQTFSGLIPVAFDQIDFSNPNANTPPNYQTGTVKKGVTTVGTLSLTYDSFGTLTNVTFTAA